MPDIDQTRSLLGFTVQIVAAHVKNNQIAAAQLPALIRQVHAALSRAGTEPAAPPAPEKIAAPAAPKKTVFPDYIICLEDGRRMKTLKRHLRSTYDMSPEQYRDKWDLPPDYPMVAPSYAARRSKLARELGLGRRAAEADVEIDDVDRQEPLPQMPARTWQIVSAPAPTPVAAAPAPAVTAAAPEPRRTEPTLDSVFSKFPKGRAGPEDIEPAPEDTPATAQQRSARKPFSKQLARTMRR
jgi:predicted transcriptional regulator